MSSGPRPLTLLPKQKVPDEVWNLLDEAAALGWPAVDGVRQGRSFWLFTCLPFSAKWKPPNTRKLRRELDHVRKARVVGVQEFTRSRRLTSQRFNEAWHQAVADAVPLRDDLEAAYAIALASLARRSATTLRNRAHSFAILGGADPGWAIPDQDVLYDLALAQLLLRQESGPRRVAVVKAVLNDVAAELGLSFDLSNPLLKDVFGQFGTQIRGIAETQRAELMQILQDAHQQGQSIEQAARAMAAEGRIDAISRARTIARTEFIGAVNGASHAAARIAGVAQYKQWLATEDSRTRPDHADADAQVVPINAPFTVGGATGMYPGDPNLPADEAVACRCTLIYVDSTTPTDSFTVPAGHPSKQ